MIATMWQEVFVRNSYLAFVETNVCALEGVVDLERVNEIAARLLKRRQITVTDVFDRILRSPQCNLGSEYLLSILGKSERCRVASRFSDLVCECGPGPLAHVREIPSGWVRSDLEDESYHAEDRDVHPEDGRGFLIHLKECKLKIGDPDVYEWMVMNQKAVLCDEDHPLGTFLSPDKYWERRVGRYTAKRDFVRAKDELKKALRGLYGPTWSVRDFANGTARPASGTAASRVLGRKLAIQLYESVLGSPASLEGFSETEIFTKISVAVKAV